MISRIETIIKENNLTAKEFATILGVQQSKITDWRTGKTKPTINDIIGISQNFKVSTDYILTGKQTGSSLTEREELLIKWYRECNEIGRDHIMQTADMVRERYKKDISNTHLESDVG